MSNLAYLQVTRECNQNCLFCSNPANNQKLDLSKAKKIIDRFISEGCDGVILTGGEPSVSENIFKIIDYLKKKKLEIKMITNAQIISDKNYLNKIINAGVGTFHVSIYSIRKEIQAYLSGKNDSFDNIAKALENLREYKHVAVSINTVINKFNSNHLSENVVWLLENFPYINHFVWNNIDPQNLDDSTRKKVVPKLNDFYLELKKATDYLKKKQKTFRVERVPLCYMPGFEDVSTETRKIVKGEDRKIYFLDKKRKFFNEKKWYYDKFEFCEICSLNEICAGLYMGKNGVNDKNELFPVFVSKEEIKFKIKNS